MKFRIIAWGSEELPDINIETDEIPPDLGWKYRCIDIQYLDMVRLYACHANGGTMP